MNKPYAILLLIAYLFADIFLTLLAFCFYAPSFQFEGSLIKKFTLWQGYDYLTYPSEFLIFTLLRILLVITGICMSVYCKKNTVRQLTMPLLGFFIFTWTATLIKFLVFAEDSAQLGYFGVWLSVIWNVLATGLLFPIWYCILCTDTLAKYRVISSDGEAGADSNAFEAAQQLFAKRRGTFEYAFRLIKYCRQQWAWFTVGFICLLIYSLARVFIPNYNGEVISNIYQRKSIYTLMHSVMYICGLSLISTIFGGLRAGAFDYAAALVNRQIRRDLFCSIVRQEIGFFDVTKTGEIVSRLSADCQAMSHIVSTNVNLFLRNGIMLVGGLAFMFALSWRLTLASFVFVPLIGYITKLYGAYYDRLSEGTQATIAQANQVAEEVVSTIRTVRSFACEKREVGRFGRHLNDTLKYNKKTSLGYMGYILTNEFTDNVILVGVLFYGGHLVISDKLTPENFIKILLYQLQLGENLYNIGVFFTGIMEGVGASRKVFEYMLRQPKEYQNGNLRPLSAGEIRFDGVKFAYPSRPTNTVLKNVNFVINPGETIALVGPSGSGKTSIVSLIEHFYEPDSGCISVDGVSVKEFDHEYLHQKIALVAQEPILYDGTVRENILYGCDWATEDDMITAAKDANVHDFILETEKGYNTNCGEKGIQLSGGQKQRIAIARALVRRPVVLILDEATSALDAESEHLVQEAINRCSANRTVIIIAHRLSTVENADRIMVINKGRVVQQGKHTELLEQEGLYKVLVTRQLLGHNDLSKTASEATLQVSRSGAVLPTLEEKEGS